MEVFILPIVAIWILVATSTWKFYFPPWHRVRSNRFALIANASAGLLSSGVIFLVLLFLSARDVRSDSEEIAFYFFLSVTWVAATQLAFSLLGISLRDDVAERGNRPAAFATSGLTLGSAFCVAGANVGDGPGVEAVLFCAVLSTGTLLLIWLLFNRIAGAAETITVDRDLGTGIRTGGLLVGTGLIFGVSVSGDWVSLGATLYDFVRLGWAAIVPVLVLVVFERRQAAKPLSVMPGGVVSGIVAAVTLLLCGGYARWVGLQ